MRVAIYGKGGIGKSTMASNISYSMSAKGHKVLQIGCDPKADSTRSLLKGKVQTTVTEYMRDTPPSKRKLDDIVNIGSNGVLCIEAGGPKPGVGCAGKGIVGMFQTLERMDYSSLGTDVIIYDVLGDVVCGGFAVPMRSEHSDAVVIVTSGEYMSLFAANNIMKGSKSFENGKGRIAGLILNRRGLDNEDALVDEFSRATGVPVICRIGRSEHFREAESKGITVCELYHDSEEAQAFSELADSIVDNYENGCISPTPLTDIQMDILYSTGRCEGRGQFMDEPEKKHSAPSQNVSFSAPRRIGKGPVSAVQEAGKVMDIPVVVHGTKSCGYTMLCEVSNDRLDHLMEDPEAFVASGENIRCTGMTSDSAVFGGVGALRSLLDDLVEENKVILVISTCLPGMIGDDCVSVISDVMSKNPGSKILFVDANRVDSGFDAHIEVIRELSKLVDESVEPLEHYVNVIDDSFVEFNKGNNRRYLDDILSRLDLVEGPGFLNDSSISDIINLRRYGIAVLGDSRRDNLIVRRILESRGVEFMEAPLPRGYQETIDWVMEISERTGRESMADPVIVSVRKEFQDAVSKYSPLLDKRKMAIASWSPKEDSWISEALSACGCHVSFHTIIGKNECPDNTMVYNSVKEMVNGMKNGCYDLIMDCMGSLDFDGSISGPRTYLAHLASIDLMRSVCGAIRSNRNEGWKSWGE